MAAPSQQKASLRSALLGRTQPKKSKVFEFNGEKFEVRAPTLAQQSAINQAALLGLDNKGRAQIDIVKMSIAAAVACTFVPGTDEVVFDAADMQVIMELPADSFIMKLGGEAIALGQLVDAEAKEDAKKSEPTPNASSSTT